MENICLRPIGQVKNEITSPQDDHWGEVISELWIDAIQFSTDALLGIDDYSHLEVIFFMHRVDESAIPTGARHPRNLGHLPKIGIFAQRPKARPNRLGLSRCQLLQQHGMVLTVKGLDAINESPILDIKPYFLEFGPRGPVHQPRWTREILENYF